MVPAMTRPPPSRTPPAPGHAECAHDRRRSASCSSAGVRRPGGAPRPAPRPTRRRTGPRSPATKWPRRPVGHSPAPPPGCADRAPPRPGPARCRWSRTGRRSRSTGGPGRAVRVPAARRTTTWSGTRTTQMWWSGTSVIRRRPWSGPPSSTIVPVSATATAQPVTTLSTRSSSCGVLSAAVRDPLGVRRREPLRRRSPGGTSTVFEPALGEQPADHRRQFVRRAAVHDRPVVRQVLGEQIHRLLDAPVAVLAQIVPRNRLLVRRVVLSGTSASARRTRPRIRSLLLTSRSPSRLAAVRALPPVAERLRRHRRQVPGAAPRLARAGQRPRMEAPGARREPLAGAQGARVGERPARRAHRRPLGGVPLRGLAAPPCCPRGSPAPPSTTRSRRCTRTSGMSMATGHTS